MKVEARSLKNTIGPPPPIFHIYIINTVQETYQCHVHVFGMHLFRLINLNRFSLCLIQFLIFGYFGFIIQVDGNGTAFTLSTGDGQDVRVIMQEPVSIMVGGGASFKHEKLHSNCVV